MEMYHKCDICDRSFSTGSNLYRHIRGMHKTEAASNPGKLRCPLCTEQFTEYQYLQIHLMSKHDIDIQAEYFAFESNQDFLNWKTNVEKETLSQFVQRCGKSVRNGLKTVKYYCHRSGNYVSKVENRKRSLKNQGSVKVGWNCPARIFTVEVVDGCIEVEYVKTHVGHEQDLKRIQLKRAERQIIADKMKEHLSMDAILNDVQTSVPEQTWKRMRLLNRRDIHNIVRDFKLSRDNVPVLNMDDAKGVDEWVEQMSLTSSNPVRFYKREGELFSSCPELGIADFLMVIMTDAQKEMLASNGDIVIVHNTRASNSFDFELVTLFVVDKKREGFPCAFIFSNRQDEPVLKLAFKSIQNVLVNVSPSVFMSGDEVSSFDAWQATFGFHGRRFLCDWHVRRDWKKHLALVKREPAAKRSLQTQLWSVLEESDIATFHCMLEKLLSQLCEHSDTKALGDYIAQHYAQRCPLWAYCYRFFPAVNVSACIASMHGIIKYDHVGGKRIKQLNKSVQAAMNYLHSIEKGKVSRKWRDLRRRHNSSITLSGDTVLPIGENNWNVMSSSEIGELYHVQYVNMCVNECTLYCDECQACFHNYSCTCKDHSVKGNMCEHIHLVCRVKNTNAETRSEASNAGIEDPTDTPDTQPTALSIETLRRNFIQEAELLVERHFGNANSEQELNVKFQNLKRYFHTCDMGSEESLKLNNHEIRQTTNSVVPQWDDWLSVVVVEQ